MSEVLDEVYLPFTETQLREHFAPVGADKTSADKHLDYDLKSIQAAKDWASKPPSVTAAERAQAKRHGLQMQKDERFWVVTDRRAKVRAVSGTPGVSHAPSA